MCQNLASRTLSEKRMSQELLKKQLEMIILDEDLK